VWTAGGDERLTGSAGTAGVYARGETVARLD